MKERNKILQFLSDALFPKFCFKCQKEGSYLCEDCLATLDINPNCFCLCEKPNIISEATKCRKCSGKFLDGLYFSSSYKNNLVKRLIQKLKYEPYAKELASTLALLIITHFNLMQKTFSGENFILVPTPLSKKKLKKRGFNQSEEIAKELAKNLNIPLLSGCLVKNKETLNQMELKKEERLKNVKNAFSVKNSEAIKNKNILLIDDVYTTGATMEECARVLKQAGAGKVFGVTVARGE
jgi:ComF family protein